MVHESEMGDMPYSSAGAEMGEMPYETPYASSGGGDVMNMMDPSSSYPTQPTFAQVKRVPVKLYADEEGNNFFYLKRYTFPHNKITKLIIKYGKEQQKQAKKVQPDQVQQQDVVMLYNCPIECHLEGSNTPSNMTADEYLTDSSFELPGYKIAAIRIRMYLKQKVLAQQQLSELKDVITLSCNVECRLVPADNTTGTETGAGAAGGMGDEENFMDAAAE